MIESYVLPGDAVFPEGITEGGDGRTFYVGSSSDGTIFAGRIDRASIDIWREPDADGPSSALGMAADEHGRLVVCGGEAGRLFAYDTETRSLIRSWTAQGSLLNDIAIVDDIAYVTDSHRPVIWRLDLSKLAAPASNDAAAGIQATELEEWLVLDPDEKPYPELPPDVLPSYLNGIVARDGLLLVVAQGTGVLWRIDTATGEVSRVDLGGQLLQGDGMVFAGDILYVLDNDDEPDGGATFYLTALTLSDDLRSGKVISRVQQSPDATPTTAAFLDGRLYLVNSQFGARRAGRAKPPFTVSTYVPPAT